MVQAERVVRVVHHLRRLRARGARRRAALRSWQHGRERALEAIRQRRVMDS